MASGSRRLSPSHSPVVKLVENETVKATYAGIA
jgi:hypothetical protein